MKMHVKSVRVSYSPQCQQKVSKKCHLIQVALLIYSFDLFIKAANNQAFSIYKGLAYYLLRPCMCKPNRCSAEMSFLWPCCLFCWKETNKLKKSISLFQMRGTAVKNLLILFSSISLFNYGPVSNCKLWAWMISQRQHMSTHCISTPSLACTAFWAPQSTSWLLLSNWWVYKNWC